MRRLRLANVPRKRRVLSVIGFRRGAPFRMLIVGESDRTLDSIVVYGGPSSRPTRTGSAAIRLKLVHLPTKR